ncbi:uncharacterized protein BYT42DRAFT_509844 [Radiomyces spectabilis]|uniref:uncharacterized protein n=1 Tax=Radiomyces spectabilis TaxID=64574 RepID=UPI00221EC071|nr:uncharacterized protein BYT42DRAFT_509844 [Radiomyces spectabilis]KAI8391690.1 hypothetical protein BYT42DRAFT_509844 [Radiomyces spectabilis]
MVSIDTELTQLNLCDQLRANSSFMKVIATIFHYGNQSMNAAQLVIAVRALDLLPLRGETPKSTVQGIISTSRKTARDLRQPDPFRIEKDESGRQAKYSISDSVLNGVTPPEPQEIPDEPIILKPVEHASYSSSYASQLGKRHRKAPKYYSPEAALRKANRRRARASKLKRKQNANYSGGESEGSEIDVDTDDELSFGSGSEEESQMNTVPEEDTINNYSLLYSPPTTEMTYIDPINFAEYPIAGHFAIVQQKGYTYPRFRSHEKVKIPKVHCEDKFRVADIVQQKKDEKPTIVGRMFILADGHGGPGCSEFFVRNTPAAIQKLCADYDPTEFGDIQVQRRFETDVKRMVEALDEEYLAMKRIELGRQKDAQPKQTPETDEGSKNESTDKMELDATSEPSVEQHVDNDGSTLIINLFFGSWMVNVNVGDSRSILISAPEPSNTPAATNTNPHGYPVAGAVDLDYKMDVVFASQDHKPYLEHLAREILENGGEFVDSVQNRVIKVELDKLREDGNRHAKRLALKNARIRPKGYHAGHDQSNGSAEAETGNTTAQLTQASSNHASVKSRSNQDRIPSLNVARSCGDLDFKMDPKRKIISCEPDVNFIRICDDDVDKQDENMRTVLTSAAHKGKRRHFLFMSTDGTFDYMYEETAERQNRAIAKVIGPMIEDGEKIGKYYFENPEEGQTIEHGKKEEDVLMKDADPKTTETTEPKTTDDATAPTASASSPTPVSKTTSGPTPTLTEPVESSETVQSDKSIGSVESAPQAVSDATSEPSSAKMSTDEPTISDNEPKAPGQESQAGSKDEPSTNGPDLPAEPPRVPLLYRELNEQEALQRKIKERTLVMAARYFANRESAHGFFASTLQDYDDCTIILIEI